MEIKFNAKILVICWEACSRISFNQKLRHIGMDTGGDCLFCHIEEETFNRS